MPAGILIAIAATAVSVIASVFGLLSKKQDEHPKVILKTNGKEEEFALTSEQVDRLKRQIRAEQEVEHERTVAAR